MMTVNQETYQIFHIINIVINSLVQIYQDKQIRILLNLLDEANDFKFVTKKWNIVNDNQKANYGVGSEVINNTEDLKSNLCDYSDAYILHFYYRTSSNTSCI